MEKGLETGADFRPSSTTSQLCDFGQVTASLSLRPVKYKIGLIMIFTIIVNIHYVLTTILRSPKYSMCFTSFNNTRLLWRFNEARWKWHESVLETLKYYAIIKLLLFSHCHVRLFEISWTAARQASLSFTISWSLLKLMSIELMLSNHLIFCHPLFLLPSIFHNIRVFSNELALHISWPKYWSFSFSISTSSQYSGLISFRIDYWQNATNIHIPGFIAVSPQLTGFFLIWTFISFIIYSRYLAHGLIIWCYLSNSVI